MPFGTRNNIIQNVVTEGVFLREGKSDERSERADAEDLLARNDGVFAREHFAQLARDSRKFSFVLHEKPGLKNIFPGKDSTLRRRVNRKTSSKIPYLENFRMFGIIPVWKTVFSAF